LGEDIDKIVENWKFEPLSLSEDSIRLQEVIRCMELLIIYAFRLESADITKKINVAKKEDK
jgi:hypothetical protein